MDSFKRSLEELFSDFAPPAPDGAPPAPQEEKPPAPAPAPRPPGGDRRSGIEILGQEEPGISLLGAHIRNIRAQIWGSVLIVLVIILWTAFLLGNAMIWRNRAEASVREEMMRVSAALIAGKAAAEFFTAIGQGTLAQDPRLFTETVTEARQRLQEAQNRLWESAADLPMEDSLWTELIRLRAAVVATDDWTTYLINAARQHRWGSIQTSQLYLVPYHLQKISEAADRVEQLTAERLAAARAEVEAARQMVRNVAIAWGVVLLLVISGVSIALLRSIAEPLEQLEKASARLAAGHLETRVAVDRVDEFGRLAQAFNEMADRLQTLYNELEERVRERTRALQEANYTLQRRAIQLEASAEVSRSIISIFNVDELLRRAVHLIRDRFGFYHAGIFLMNETGEWAVLREATGEAGAQMKAMGHRLRVGETSMVGWTALHRRPRIALDVGEDAVHFANPLLPYTRSEMTLPLMVGGRLLGVLDVQSTEEAAFDEDDIRTLQSMADQLSMALENARRLSETAALLEATSPIYRFSRRLGTAATVEDVAEVIIEAVSETEADGCVVVEFESSNGVPEMLSYRGVWRRDWEPMFQPGMRMAITETPLPVPMLRQIWVSEDAQRDSQLSDQAREFFRATGVGALVNVPLQVGDQAIGQVVILRSAPGPFSPASLRLYEVIGDQATVALERARLLEEAQHRAARERLVAEISARLRASLDPDTVLKTTVRELGWALRARWAAVEVTGLPQERTDRSQEVGG